MELKHEKEDYSSYFTTYSDEEDCLVDTTPIEPSSHKTTSFDYEGINIQFPYEAYSCQKQLMETIIQGVSKGQNCLLESPTGTGKTAALLCSLLAWQQHQENKPDEAAPPKRMKIDVTQNGDQNGPAQVSKIYYATRTLKHIDQIIDQLRETSYCNTPMAILTSMKNTCNNKSNAPLRSDPLGLTTDADIDEHYCQFNPTGLKWSQHLNRQHEDKTWNIEELKTFSVKNETCPYFELLEAAKGAKIIFCTYGYLLKADMRKALNLDLENNILVFDEGHNVEDVCYQTASTPEGFLTYKNLTKFASILESGLNSSAMSEDKKRFLQQLTHALRQFGDFLSTRYFKEEIIMRTDLSTKLDIPFMNFCQDLKLAKIDFGPEKLSQLRKNYYDILCNQKRAVGSNEGHFKVSREALRYVADLMRVLEFMWERFASPTRQGQPEIFKIFLTRKLSKLPIEEQPSTMLLLDCSIDIQIMCLSPAVAFCHLRGTRSIIITSGTLSPIESFSQLGIKFERKYEYQSDVYIVPSKRVFCKLINKYEDCSTHFLELTSYRNNQVVGDSKWEDITNQLANIVIDIYHKVGKGMLVFVQSEAFSRRLQEMWKNNGRWKAFEGTNKILFERKGMRPEEVKEMVEDYRKNSESAGAVLIAYMRGKFSEAIDFKDDHARTVVAIGIPFLPKNNLFVESKMKYQNKMIEHDLDSLNGDEWYENNAFRAYNQTIGRNIRHDKDWGAVFMLGKRWDYNDKQLKLPKWIRETFKNSEGCEEVRAYKEVLNDFSRFVGEFQK